MPIFVTDNTGKKSTINVGEVVEIRRFNERRNMSDTLDYSDYQNVDCCEALVYQGRTKHDWHSDSQIPRMPGELFAWVDCSNHFVWRGADHREPMIDELRHPNVVIDYCEYVEAWKVENERLNRVAEEHREAARKIAQENEHNRPVKGKKMVVFKGRKVAIGTVGVVAYIHDSGRVLLKDEKNWKDRSSQGVWVNANNLKAFEE